MKQLHSDFEILESFRRLCFLNDIQVLSENTKYLKKYCVLTNLFIFSNLKIQLFKAKLLRSEYIMKRLYSDFEILESFRR
jgi:hypothetical protein